MAWVLQDLRLFGRGLVVLIATGFFAGYNLSSEPTHIPVNNSLEIVTWDAAEVPADPQAVPSLDPVISHTSAPLHILTPQSTSTPTQAVHKADIFAGELATTRTQAEHELVYVYPASALPPIERALLELLTSCKTVSENLAGPKFKKFSQQEAATFHQYGQFLQSRRRTNDPTKASFFFIPYFIALELRKVKTCTDNQTLWKELNTIRKFRTDSVRQWLRDQPHYPAKPHFYSWMLSWTAQLEDMPNVFNLKNDGARECYGCMIECTSTTAYPRIIHVDRQQEYLGATSFRSVRDMTGIAPSDLFAPYAAQPVFLAKGSAERARDSERRVNFVFMGNRNRDFTGGWVRRNLSVILEQHGIKYNFSWVASAKDQNYSEAMYSSKYCFCPRGDDSSSGRFFDAVASGCIPIVVSDALVLPFAATINTSSFVVQLPECSVCNEEHHARTAAVLSALLAPRVYNRLKRNLLVHRQKMIHSAGSPFSPTYNSNPSFVDTLMIEMASVAQNSSARHAMLATFNPFQSPLQNLDVLMAPAQCPFLKHPRPGSSPPLVFKNARGGGRLGNQIFQYAAVLGITTYYGSPVQPVFEDSAGRRDCGTVANPFGKKLFEFRSKDPAYTPDFRKSWEDGFAMWDNRTLQYTSNTKLQSYFQSWRYFCNVLPKVLAELTYFFYVCQNGPAALQQLLHASNITVDTVTPIAVHLRLGDVLSVDPSGKSTWTVTPAWLRRALKKLGSQIPEDRKLVLVVFCGDANARQLDHCRSLTKVIHSMHWGPQRSATVVSVPNTAEHTAEKDMAIIASCKHVVITWGTFGYWPALVVNSRGGHVVAPTEPFRGEWSGGFNSADFYPPTFLQVNNSIEDFGDSGDNAPPTPTLQSGQIVVDGHGKRWVLSEEDVQICSGVRNASKEWFGRVDVQTELYRCISREPPYAWEYGKYDCLYSGCLPSQRSIPRQ